MRRTNGVYARELMRAAGGAILFSFPMLMTMEMWWLGFHIDPVRLALFLVVGLMMLVGLSRHVGFADQHRWRDDILDALSAFAVAVIVAALFLGVFGVVTAATPAGEIVGKVAVQAVPAGIGAILARKQFNAGGGAAPREGPAVGGDAGYAGEMLLMFAGAVFVAFNVAPTDEVARIADLMTPWHALALAALSLGLLHALVYGVELAGQEAWPEGHGFVGVFVRYSFAGYGIALIVGVYVLWTFGRIEGCGPAELAMLATVLGFPAALGAATARLLV